jgi:hypothetical protein
VLQRSEMGDLVPHKARVFGDSTVGKDHFMLAAPMSTVNLAIPEAHLRSPPPAAVVLETVLDVSAPQAARAAPPRMTSTRGTRNRRPRLVPELVPWDPSFWPPCQWLMN